MTNADITAADVGQHWLKLNSLDIPDVETGKMVRRFINTFANLYAGENGKIIVGILRQGEESESEPPAKD